MITSFLSLFFLINPNLNEDLNIAFEEGCPLFSFYEFNENEVVLVYDYGQEAYFGDVQLKFKNVTIPGKLLVRELGQDFDSTHELQFIRYLFQFTLDADTYFAFFVNASSTDSPTNSQIKEVYFYGKLEGGTRFFNAAYGEFSAYALKDLSDINNTTLTFRLSTSTICSFNRSSPNRVTISQRGDK